MSVKINWEQTYIQSSPKLLGVCRRYIKDISQAEDIVQESFILAIQKESLYKGTGSLEAWLNRIVINNALTFLKSKQFKNTIHISFDNENDSTIDEETTSSSEVEFSLLDILNNEFSQNDLLEIIDSLPINHKMVFNMYVIDNFSHQQISEILNISINTSKSHLLRARKKAKNKLMEKLENSRRVENKKRIIALFIFLGFGNIMFANKFKKSFQSFEIKPSRPFNPNQHIQNTSIIDVNMFKKSIDFFKMKIVVFSLFILFIVSSIIYLTSDFKSEETANSRSIYKTNRLDKLTNTKLKEKLNNNNNNNISIEKSVELKPKIKQKSNRDLKLNNISKLPTTKKDSVLANAINTLPVVIVKKKIIKRDTVYVTK